MEKKESFEERELARTRKLSIKEGNFSVLQDGCGVRHVVPYALILGQGNPYLNNFIGLLTSLPSLLGNISQLFTYKLMEKYPRKKIVAFFVLMQALTWLGLILTGALFLHLQLNSTITLSLLVFFYSFLIFIGAFAGPAWVSLMKDMVTVDKGKYFGKRNKINGAVALVAFLISGLIINYLQVNYKAYVLYGFFVLFSIALFGRTMSAFLFTKHYYPELKLEKDSYFSLLQFVKKMPYNNFGKFTIFVSTFTFAVAIGSPFFTIYLLNNLHLSYLQWTIITIVNSLTILLFMPFWGRFADRYGNLKVLKLTGTLIALYPMLYVSTAFMHVSNFNLFLILCSFEVLSGFVWAGFNLCSSNFIYDAVTRQRTTICSAYYGLVNGVGVFIGATIGGLIASSSVSFFSYGAIIFVFVVSAVARLVTYLIMINRVKEVREVECFNLKECVKEKVNNWGYRRILDLFSIRPISH